MNEPKTFKLLLVGASGLFGNHVLDQAFMWCHRAAWPSRPIDTKPTSVGSYQVQRQKAHVFC